ncbi:MAG: hypothetical protein AAF514_21725 [Verrucomicrobiota bacterium]
MKENSQRGLAMRALLEALRTTSPLLRWFAVVLLVVFLLSGIQTVGPEETGLHYRFGKLRDQAIPSGLVFTFPTPIDRLVRVPTSSVLQLELNDWSVPGSTTS